MGFNLRGGRPKNMGQGNYWVQRHRDEQRRIASREIAAKKAAEKIHAFNEKWDRIYDNYMTYMKSKINQKIEATPAKFRSLQNKSIAAEELRSYINNNIDTATMRDLSKISTMYISIMKLMAKICNEKSEYISESKILIINGNSYNFY
jgi:hypothetical protein